ncbi:hypothetical protein AB0F93_00340 [Micromonospora tulbaghiae]|uniref:hypothetical protein n=1 Tax=Micromonospora tulbaghiae TaxID=479978 RepID=UPI00331EF679
MTTAATIDTELHEARRTVRQFWNYANLCYCGTPSELMRLILGALDAHGQAGDWREDERPDLSNPTHLLLAYQLDAWDLTEHGTSLGGAWLTRDGIRLRDALRRVDLDTALADDWADNEYALYPKRRTGPTELLEGTWETQNY